MIPLQTALITLVVVFGSSMLGMLLGRLLPADHLSADMKSTVSLALGVIGTLSALVIGLLIAAANNSFSTKREAVTRLSTEIIQMDRLMRRYGPEAKGIRDSLRRYAEAKMRDLFPGGIDPQPDPQNLKTVGMLEKVQDDMLALTPRNDAQRWLHAQALQLASEGVSTRWLLAEASATSALPFPFLALVVLWLAIIFAGFGLFAPRNPTSVMALFLCATAVAGALQMIMDFDTPFRGLIRISDTQMRNALQEISR